MERHDFVFMPSVAEKYATTMAEIMATSPLPYVGGYGIYGDYGAGKTTFLARLIVEEGIRQSLLGRSLPLVRSGVTIDDIISGNWNTKVKPGKGKEGKALSKNMEATAGLIYYYSTLLSDVVG